MEPQVVHFKKKPYDVYIGRPSRWGNKFSRKGPNKVATKAEAIYKHRQWILSQPALMEEIKQELRGKVLGCWCDNPRACHGFILWAIANDQPFDQGSEPPSQQPTLF
jgi:hypothetical protein